MMRVIEGVNLYALDMEWSQTGGLVQPLELAVLSIDNDEKCFFRYIRPVDSKRLTKALCRLLKINKDKIQTALKFNRVIRDLQEYLPHEAGKDNIAVAWHEDTIEYFKNACKEYGVRNPFKEIISLKNILLKAQNRQKGRINSFENLLLEYGIDFSENAFHNSGYDVKQLKRLFHAIKIKISMYDIPNGLVSNQSSRVVHMADCRYCGNTTEGSLKAFEIDDLYRGYRYCKVCGKKIHPWIPAPTKEEMKLAGIKGAIKNISGKDQFLDSSVAAICIYFGFEYEMNKSCIEVMTACGRWKIYHDGRKITRVYHANHNGKSERKGVHEQKGKWDTMYGTLEYIKKHDTAIAENKIKYDKTAKHKSHMEKKVTHHVKRNYYIEKDEWEEYYDN